MEQKERVPGNGNDVKIAGVGTVNQGTYGVISASGVCTAAGEITADEIKSAGVFKAKENVSAGKLKTGGTASFAKDLQAGTAEFSGSCKIKGKLRAREVKISGGFSATDVEAETVLANGNVRVVGEMNVGTLELCSPNADIATLHADNVKIVISKINWYPFRGVSVPKIGVAECTAFSAEGVNAEKVSCRDAVIGKHCRIKSLEYSGTLTLDPEAEVKELIKTE